MGTYSLRPSCFDMARYGCFALETRFPHFILEVYKTFSPTLNCSKYPAIPTETDPANILQKLHTYYNIYNGFPIVP